MQANSTTAAPWLSKRATFLVPPTSAATKFIVCLCSPSTQCVTCVEDNLCHPSERHFWTTICDIVVQGNIQSGQAHLEQAVLDEVAASIPPMLRLHQHVGGGRVEHMQPIRRMPDHCNEATFIRSPEQFGPHRLRPQHLASRFRPRATANARQCGLVDDRCTPRKTPLVAESKRSSPLIPWALHLTAWRRRASSTRHGCRFAGLVRGMHPGWSCAIRPLYPRA